LPGPGPDGADIILTVPTRLRSIGIVGSLEVWRLSVRSVALPVAMTG